MHDFENSIYYCKNRLIKLTKTENRMLDLLLKNKGKVVSYNIISKHLYNSKNYKQFKNAIIITILRLRNKLKDEVEIISKRSVGYWVD